MSHTSVHLIQTSPFTSKALESCLRVCGSRDAIILMADGVYAATDAAREWPAAAVYALADDVAARGLSDKIDSKLTVIDYPEMVDICSRHRHSQSWF